MKLAAVVWDFDGTIADSNRKNYEITRTLLRERLGVDFGSIKSLSTYDYYLGALAEHANWRSLYVNAFGVHTDDLDRVGDLWGEYQLKHTYPAPIFPGIADVMRRYRDIPQGIVSQNSLENIRNTLHEGGCLEYVGEIIGYREVPYASQKPDPLGLLTCIERLLGQRNDSRTAAVVYIGDHATDEQTARNAQDVLSSQGKAIICRAVRVCFEPHSGGSASWCHMPDLLPDYIDAAVTQPLWGTR